MTQVFESPTGSAGNVGALTLVVGIEPELFQAFIPSQSISLISLDVNKALRFTYQLLP